MAATTGLPGWMYSFSGTFWMKIPLMKNSSIPAARARIPALAAILPFHLKVAKVTAMMTRIMMNPGMTLPAVAFMVAVSSGLK